MALLAFSTLATLGTGISGWILAYDAVPEFTVLDATYLAALAFVGDGLYAPPHLPDVDRLRWTRWFGLLAALSAILSVVGLAVGGHLRRVWARHLRRGAFVVVGAGADGEGLRLAESHVGRRPLTVIDRPGVLAEQTRRRHGTVLLPADPDDAEAVRRAAGRAPSDVLFGDDDPMANVARAASWTGRAPLVRIESGIVARDLELLDTRLRRVRVVSADETIARGLVSVLGLTDLAVTRDQGRVRVLMVGLGRRNLAIAEELALRCHHPQLEHLRIDVADRAPEAAEARLQRERPALRAACDIQIHALDGLQCYDADRANLLAAIEGDAELTAVIVDAGAATESMAIAMRLAQLQAERQILRAPILVRSRHAPAPLPDALHDLTGGIVAFGGDARVLAPRDTDMLSEGLAERLHEVWRAGRAADGDRDAPEWAALSSSMRRANRRAALFAVEMLRAGGLVPDGFAAPAHLRIAPGALVGLSELRRAGMARTEHVRWSAERLAEGWCPAPPGTRDDERRRHPLLQAYEALPEGEPAKDVANVDALLAEGAARQRRAPHLPCWRRRVRVGTVGPLAVSDAVLDRVEAAFGRALGQAPFGDLGGLTLEVVTPSAPGFDRQAAMRLMQVWRRRSGRDAMLLEVCAMRPAGLDTMAAAALDLADPAGLQVQRATMIAAAGLHRRIDARPLDTSDAMLAADPNLFRTADKAVADRVCDMVDLMAIWTDGGTRAGSSRSRARCVARGTPMLDLGDGAPASGVDGADASGKPSVPE